MADSVVRSSSSQEPWFTLDLPEIQAQLGVDPVQGLSEMEARKRLAHYGPNELVVEAGRPTWRLLWDQFTEPLVVVLIIAALVSGLLWIMEGSGHEPLPYDSLVILSIVILNALLGFFQEYRAEKEVEALKSLVAPEVNVRREGHRHHIPATQVVPGDVLLLEAGDKVAADARLAVAVNLNADEAALTGESVQAHKHTQALADPKLNLGDRANMVFMGTAISYGRGEALVTTTGMQTQMGGIATMIQGVEDEETPLQRELAVVGKQLGILVLVICGVVAVTGVLREGDFSSAFLINIFLFSVALAVAAIPEGLPAVVTAVLSLGVRRMAQRNAIVRRLAAVETLGSATVICSDKTGTLTRNEMTVRRILLGAQTVVGVDGEGYAPQGNFREENGMGADQIRPRLAHLLRMAALNGDAELMQDDQKRWQIEGDPTEGALVVAARKLEIQEDHLRKTFPRLGEIPFSSERKRMTTIHALPEVDDGELVAYVKGAPDVLIQLCAFIRGEDGTAQPLSDEMRARVQAHGEAFAGDALRTLGFASGPIPAHARTELGNYLPDVVETDLIWEGMVGMIDPPRSEARDSVALARHAGIRTKMITGDHAITGLAIAKELGITGPDGRYLTGRELSEMDDAALAQAVLAVDVYARVNPEHKLRIIQALKSHNQVVAMTGDGVNDAPALKQADIGVAMGITGTDVSKEASDIVLADDNFATIVAAIGEGRTIFNNIRKFIRFLLSSNMGEVLTMFLAIIGADILGLTGTDGHIFLPLLAVQILWINLITDGGPALALGVEPAEPDQMAYPPRSTQEPVIDRAMWGTILLVGGIMSLGTLAILDGYLPDGIFEFVAFGSDSDWTLRHARTMAFTTLVMFQMFNVFNARSATLSIFQVGLFKNRWLWVAVGASVFLHAVVIYWTPMQNAFETVPLSAGDWLVAVAMSSSVVVVVELLKLTRIFGRKKIASIEI